MEIKKWVLLIGLILVFVALGNAHASIFYRTPSDPDIDDLAHQYAYEWRVALSVPSGEIIQSARLSIRGIYNWA